MIELITTGTELLSDRLNKHVTFIGGSLREIGLALQRQTSVGDGDEIAPVLEEAMHRSRVVLTTGGLGPTSDDVTRDIAARLLGLDLIRDEVLVEEIREFFKRRNRTPPESVFRQALVPAGAVVLNNPHGTASGLRLQTARGHLFLLPGPPRELHPMWNNHVLPFLAEHYAPPQRPAHYHFKIAGIGESAVQERIERVLLEKFPGIGIAYCASLGVVELRLNHPQASDLSDACALVREHFRRAVQTEGNETLEAAVIRLASAHHVRLATVESCTGGLVAHRLTNIPGASAVLDTGWVTYSNEAKSAELHVPQCLIDEYGAVSAQVARAMARGALQGNRADLAVSTTGIAGPGGGTDKKPVGTVYFGVARRRHGRISSYSVKKHLVADRETFKTLASQTALELLRRQLIHYSVKY